MMRVLLFALMLCLYVHGLMTGFQIDARAWDKNKVVHVIVIGKDILRTLAMLGCALVVSCFVRL